MFDIEDSGSMPFRPCAMMLKVHPLSKLQPSKVDESIISKLQVYIESEIRTFDYDLKPAVEIKGGISKPIKASNHILFQSSGSGIKNLFEMGFAAQQALLFLSYLKLGCSLYFDEKDVVIPFSARMNIKDRKFEKPKKYGFAGMPLPEAKDLLYFELWGDHPDGFFTDNPKLDSVVRYCRYSPVIEGTGQLKFIMDKELLHLLVKTSAVKPDNRDIINAGMMLLNFIISAEMLNLKGEWKLFRDIDAARLQAFNLPEDAFHIATWHGQLF